MHNTGWWGEGEIKFYLDGDREFPTICGTGTEDYFCGSYDFSTRDAEGKSHYTEFSTLYSGLARVIKPDGHYGSQMRFGLYRWHVLDPIRFEKDLRVTIQALDWRQADDTCRCRMTSLPWPFGTKPSHIRNFPNYLAGTNWNCNDSSPCSMQAKRLIRAMKRFLA